MPAYHLLGNMPLEPAPSDPDGVYRHPAFAARAQQVVLDRSNVSLLRLLRRIVSDQATLTGVAQLSHRHQLGFEKFVLGVDNAGRSLRLHLWDAQSTFSPEDVHSHCAAFTSRIVLGSFCESRFEMEEGDTHSLFRYRASVDGHQDAVSCGTCRVLRAATSVRRRPGDIYSREATDLHHVREVDPGTVSISIWEPRLAQAWVVKPRGATARECLAPQGMDSQSVLKRLIDISNRLQQHDLVG